MKASYRSFASQPTDFGAHTLLGNPGTDDSRMTDNRMLAGSPMMMSQGLSQRSAVGMGSNTGRASQHSSLLMSQPLSQSLCSQGLNMRPTSGGGSFCPTPNQPALSGVFRPHSAPSQRPTASQLALQPGSNNNSPWGQQLSQPNGIISSTQVTDAETAGAPAGLGIHHPAAAGRNSYSLLQHKPLSVLGRTSAGASALQPLRPGSAPTLQQHTSAKGGALHGTSPGGLLGNPGAVAGLAGGSRFSAPPPISNVKPPGNRSLLPSESQQYQEEDALGQQQPNHYGQLKHQQHASTQQRHRSSTAGRWARQDVASGGPGQHIHPPPNITHPRHPSSMLAAPQGLPRSGSQGWEGMEPTVPILVGSQQQQQVLTLSQQPLHNAAGPSAGTQGQHVIPADQQFRANPPARPTNIHDTELQDREQHQAADLSVSRPAGVPQHGRKQHHEDERRVAAAAKDTTRPSMVPAGTGVQDPNSKVPAGTAHPLVPESAPAAAESPKAASHPAAAELPTPQGIRTSAGGAAAGSAPATPAAPPDANQELLLHRISSLEDHCSSMNLIISRDIPLLLQQQAESSQQLQELTEAASSNSNSSSTNAALEAQLRQLTDSVGSFMAEFKHWQQTQESRASIVLSHAACQTTPGVAGSGAEPAKAPARANAQHQQTPGSVLPPPPPPPATTLAASGAAAGSGGPARKSSSTGPAVSRGSSLIDMLFSQPPAAPPVHAAPPAAAFGASGAAGLSHAVTSPSGLRFRSGGSKATTSGIVPTHDGDGAAPAVAALASPLQHAVVKDGRDGCHAAQGLEKQAGDCFPAGRSMLAASLEAASAQQLGPQGGTQEPAAAPDGESNPPPPPPPAAAAAGAAAVKGRSKGPAARKVGGSPAIVAKANSAAAAASGGGRGGRKRGSTAQKAEAGGLVQSKLQFKRTTRASAAAAAAAAAAALDDKRVGTQADDDSEAAAPAASAPPSSAAAAARAAEAPAGRVAVPDHPPSHNKNSAGGSGDSAESVKQQQQQQQPPQKMHAQGRKGRAGLAGQGATRGSGSGSRQAQQSDVKAAAAHGSSAQSGPAAQQAPAGAAVAAAGMAAGAPRRLSSGPVSQLAARPPPAPALLSNLQHALQQQQQQPLPALGSASPKAASGRAPAAVAVAAFNAPSAVTPAASMALPTTIAAAGPGASAAAGIGKRSRSGQLLAEVTTGRAVSPGPAGRAAMAAAATPSGRGYSGAAGSKVQRRVSTAGAAASSALLLFGDMDDDDDSLDGVISQDAVKGTGSRGAAVEGAVVSAAAVLGVTPAAAAATRPATCNAQQRPTAPLAAAAGVGYKPGDEFDWCSERVPVQSTGQQQQNPQQQQRLIDDDEIAQQIAAQLARHRHKRRRAMSRQSSQAPLGGGSALA